MKLNTNNLKQNEMTKDFEVTIPISDTLGNSNIPTLLFEVIVSGWAEIKEGVISYGVGQVIELNNGEKTIIPQTAFIKYHLLDPHQNPTLDDPIMAHLKKEFGVYDEENFIEPIVTLDNPFQSLHQWKTTT